MYTTVTAATALDRRSLSDIESFWAFLRDGPGMSPLLLDLLLSLGSTDCTIRNSKLSQSSALSAQPQS